MRSNDVQVTVAPASSSSGKKSQNTDFSGTKMTYPKCHKDSGKSRWTKTKDSREARICRSSAIVTSRKASRTVRSKATMKSVEWEEAREMMTGLGSRTKLTTKMTTEFLRMEASAVVEEEARDSVVVEVGFLEEEVVLKIAQVEAVVIPGASRVKNMASSNLPTRPHSKTENSKAMTPNLPEAERIKEDKLAMP